jgi:hypothetical protein
MTALALLCLLTVLVNIVRDLFIPSTRDVEIWFGFEVFGSAARLTAPLHWAIFAMGAWAFWTQRPWATTAAAIYLFYAALSHVIWSEASPNGRGWPIGLMQAAAISTAAILLLRFGSRLPRTALPADRQR